MREVAGVEILRKHLDWRQTGFLARGTCISDIRWLCYGIRDVSVTMRVRRHVAFAVLKRFHMRN